MYIYLYIRTKAQYLQSKNNGNHGQTGTIGAAPVSYELTRLATTEYTLTDIERNDKRIGDGFIILCMVVGIPPLPYSITYWLILEHHTLSV